MEIQERNVHCRLVDRDVVGFVGQLCDFGMLDFFRNSRVFPTRVGISMNSRENSESVALVEVHDDVVVVMNGIGM